ncbi:MAG TPA: chromate transporter, partial [Candidatus Baltobacteraceae bacterium]|nr:chromate transporter [Candidatus Baltobacteraceae bacterium]
LAGNRLRGWAGASAALLGMCLPGFIFMTIAGILYGDHGDRPLVTAALKGVAAAAVGLIAATWYQLGRKSVRDNFDAFIIVLAIAGINQFKLSVPVTLIVVGAIAIFHHRPGRPKEDTESKWISSLQ